MIIFIVYPEININIKVDNMSNNISIIKEELLNDPLLRGYGAMTDEEVLADFKLFYRDIEGSLLEMLSFITKNRARTNEGTDTQNTAILGRLIAVANADVNSDVFGSGRLTTLEQKHAASTFVFILNNNNMAVFDFVDTEVEAMINKLNGNSGNAGVWTNSDGNTLKALSQNKQTRPMELGLSVVKLGHITEARNQ